MIGQLEADTMRKFSDSSLIVAAGGLQLIAVAAVTLRGRRQDR
jgi:hypothetical protein